MSWLWAASRIYIYERFANQMSSVHYGSYVPARVNVLGALPNRCENRVIHSTKGKR